MIPRRSDAFCCYRFAAIRLLTTQLDHHAGSDAGSMLHARGRERERVYFAETSPAKRLEQVRVVFSFSIKAGETLGRATTLLVAKMSRQWMDCVSDATKRYSTATHGLNNIMFLNAIFLALNVHFEHIEVCFRFRSCVQ